jgi:hypothetical protein
MSVDGQERLLTAMDLGMVVARDREAAPRKPSGRVAHGSREGASRKGEMDKEDIWRCWS